MAIAKEERDRILSLVESGRVTAEEASQLFDAFQEQQAVVPPPPPSNRTLRVWVTDTATRSRKVNMTATLPVNLLRVSLQALASMVPPLRDGRAEQIIASL